jgi:acetyl-CoA acetyltransferase
MTAGDVPRTADRDRFRFRAGRPSLDLCSTLLWRHLSPIELLHEPGDVARWLREAGLSGDADVANSADLERARALREDPVAVLGIGEAHSHRHISSMPDLTTTCAVESGARAFAEAGLRPADVDVVELYDAFTITPVLFLEDLGFCAKGEGGAFVQDGAIAPGGRLAVNTNGGGLSYQHPGMYGLLLLVEAVRQVRDAGRDVVLAHGNGGVLSSQCTAIVGSEAACGN